MATYAETYPYERRIGERRRDYAARLGGAEGLKVSWGGIWGGVLVAIGLLLLLSVLGVAIGVTAVDPGDTQAESVGAGIGVWGGLSLLIALFVGGMVSTRIGAIFDRTTGFFEGALVWAVSVLLMIYLATTGVGMLASGAFNMVRGVGSAVGVMAQDGDVSSGDVNQILSRLRIVDRDGSDAAAGVSGEILVKGANITPGYWNNQAATGAAFTDDGWLKTGDLGRFDEDGFLYIEGRLSRFSKIGGEMVPHMKVEETINEVLGSHAAAVTALPDEKRGEKLIAFYAQNGFDREELWEKLNQSGLPKLWIPKREDLHPVESLPLLGSGKVDLKQIKAMAQERAQKPVS